jgi:hypothetical protein
MNTLGQLPQTLMHKITTMYEPRQLSLYSDWLRTGQKSRSSSSGRVKNFHLFISSRLALCLTQPPIQWLPGVKRTGRDVKLTTHLLENVGLCMHSPICLHDVVLTWLRTWINLSFFISTTYFFLKKKHGTGYSGTN